MFTITRQDEMNFPEFTTLAEARFYFKKKYGEQYKEGGWERLDEDTICYFDEVNYQPVQISVHEDGTVSVHIVY